MPMSIVNTAGGTAYTDPFIGGPVRTAQIKVDVSGLTTDEVDANGYLKPGTMLTRAGILVGSAAFPFGVVNEAVRVHTSNTSLGSVTADVFVTVGVIGLINRDVAEDNLGRAYTSDELAGFDLAGSKIALTAT